MEHMTLTRCTHSDTSWGASPGSSVRQVSLLSNTRPPVHLEATRKVIHASTPKC